jgi:hypothetical protein
MGFPPTTQLVATRLAYRLHTTSQRLFHETVTRERTHIDGGNVCYWHLADMQLAPMNVCFRE